MSRIGYINNIYSTKKKVVTRESAVTNSVSFTWKCAGIVKSDTPVLPSLKLGNNPEPWRIRINDHRKTDIGRRNVSWVGQRDGLPPWVRYDPDLFSPDEMELAPYIQYIYIDWPTMISLNPQLQSVQARTALASGASIDLPQMFGRRFLMHHQ